MRARLILLVSALALGSCGQEADNSSTNRPQIKVRGATQDALHDLDAMNLAIALKRAIYGAGYRCKRITDAGFVGEYQNLDMASDISGAAGYEHWNLVHRTALAKRRHMRQTRTIAVYPLVMTRW